MLKHIKLYESYQSQKDIEYLAKAIFNMFASNALEKLDGNHQKIKWFDSVMLNVFNPNAFGTLSDFIKDFGDLEIIIVSKEEFSRYSNGQAAYLRISDKDGKVDQRLILLIEDEYTLSVANKFVSEWDYDQTHMTERYIGDTLSREYKSQLIHELQHAYDDWRSGGKALHEPKGYTENQKELHKLTSAGLEQLKEEERELVAKYHKEYLNLKHEVDARFSAAIDKLEFYELDWDATLDQNKNVYMMKPFEKLLKDFKGKIYPYIVLTDEHKKRVLRKFGQFYEMERDLVAKKNAESESFG